MSVCIVYFIFLKTVLDMLVNFIRNSALLLAIGACGMPGNELATAGGEAQSLSANIEQEQHIYRLELSKVADVAVGEKILCHGHAQ